MTQGIANVSVGEQFEGFLLIKSAEKGVASNGKPFLTIIFRDRSGEIDAKLWEITKDDEEVFTPESVVHVQGDIRQFRGKAQLNVRQIRLATAADGIHPEDFMEKAPIPVEEMQEYMTKLYLICETLIFKGLFVILLRSTNTNYSHTQLRLKSS